MIVATVDTTACGLFGALFVRLRFQHDGVVTGATDGAVGVAIAILSI